MALAALQGNPHTIRPILLRLAAIDRLIVPIGDIVLIMNPLHLNVVLELGLLVPEAVVGLDDPEPLLDEHRVLGLVGMVLQHQLPVGLLYLLEAGSEGQAQDPVVVLHLYY